MHFDKSSKKSIKYRKECGLFWGAWYVVCGMRYAVCGVWYAVCGVWFGEGFTE